MEWGDISAAAEPRVTASTKPVAAAPEGGDAKPAAATDSTKAREHTERRRAPVPDQPPFKIFVRNLPYRATRKDVGEFFQGSCGPVEDVHLLENKEHQPKGMGFVEFKARESLVAALEFDGKEVLGRLIEVNVAEPQPAKKERFGREDRFGREGREGREGRDGRKGEGKAAAFFAVRDGGKTATTGDFSSFKTRQNKKKEDGEESAPAAGAAAPKATASPTVASAPAPEGEPRKKITLHGDGEPVVHKTPVAREAIFGDAKPRTGGSEAPAAGSGGEVTSPAGGDGAAATADKPKKKWTKGETHREGSDGKWRSPKNGNKDRKFQKPEKPTFLDEDGFEIVGAADKHQKQVRVAHKEARAAKAAAKAAGETAPAEGSAAPADTEAAAEKPVEKATPTPAEAAAPRAAAVAPVIPKSAVIAPPVVASKAEKRSKNLFSVLDSDSDSDE